MVLNTNTHKYEMTQDEYEEIKSSIRGIQPYSKEEMSDIGLDGKCDIKRLSATARQNYLDNAIIIN